MAVDKFFNDIIQNLLPNDEREYLNAHKKIFAEKIDDDTIAFKLKMYYKENGKFYEQISTCEVTNIKDSLSAEVIDMIVNANGEIDISDLCNL